MRTILAALLLLGCTAAAVGIFFAVSGSRSVRVAADDIAAAGDPHLFNLEGERTDLAQLLESDVAVFIFARTDCPVSNRYAPEVRKLYELFHPQGVSFHLVYVDPKESPESIRTHLEEYEYPCPALHDREHRLVRYTQATVTPEAVVFDSADQIAYRGRISDLYADFGNARAAATKNDLQAAIEATLAGQPVAEPVTKAIGCYIEDLK